MSQSRISNEKRSFGFSFNELNFIASRLQTYKSSLIKLSCYLGHFRGRHLVESLKNSRRYQTITITKVYYWLIIWVPDPCPENLTLFRCELQSAYHLTSNQQIKNFHKIFVVSILNIGIGSFVQASLKLVSCMSELLWFFSASWIRGPITMSVFDVRE